MVKYVFEGNINFYEELYKSLDNNTDNDINDNNICQITGMPLIDKHVALECGHKFNYDALYTEICKQKFTFMTYTLASLTGDMLEKFRDADKNYFIRCPYCRNIQFELLPYYPDSIYKKRYGINTLELTPEDKHTLLSPSLWPGDHIVVINGHSYTFKKREKSNEYCKSIIINNNGKDIYCGSAYTYFSQEINKYCCAPHLKYEIKQYNNEQKILLMKKRKDEREQKKQAKELEKEQKKQAKELEKEQKKQNKVKITNTVISQNIEIGEFNETPLVNTCSAILKSGEKKGQMCGAKIKINGLCLRHSKVNLEE